jgi:hypothetical protein
MLPIDAIECGAVSLIDGYFSLADDAIRVMGHIVPLLPV